jgi:transaldolase
MQQLTSKIFMDGGDAEETRTADKLLRTIRPEWQRGIDGQTTNPTLVARNPDIQKYLASGKRLTATEALIEYRKIVEAIAQVTQGPISIQVIADQSTPADEMLRQARVYKEWVPSGVVKFPCTTEGLAAAETFCQEYPVNITLNFSQAQAAAVYQATRQALYQVFISPFVGRLDDRGENGMDLVVNELEMYRSGDGHVDVLTASVRTLDHLMDAISLQSPAITIPMKLFQQWADQGFSLPDENFTYNADALKPIPYQEFSLDKNWRNYDLHHDLTEAGLTRFTQDWQNFTK